MLILVVLIPSVTPSVMVKAPVPVAAFLSPSAQSMIYPLLTRISPAPMKTRQSISMYWLMTLMLMAIR